MIRCLINLVLIFITINEALAVKVCNSSVINNGQSRIGIFISPIVSELPIHEIEIYWNNMKPYEKIVLLDTSRLDSPIVLYNVSSNGPSGFERTGVQAKFVPSSHLSFTQRCTGYSVALLTATSDLKEVNCLKTQPTWMKERQNILGPRRISEIFLPGTHDSASYAEDDTGNFITNNAVTQSWPLPFVKRDLVDESWAAVSVSAPEDSYRSGEAVPQQHRRNCDNGLPRVPRFNDIAIHRKLVSYLEDKFQDYFLANSHGWFATLNDIWSSGKRLIIGYRHTRIVQERDSVWPCVQHQWGNVRNVKDLYRHLNQIESSDSDSRVRPRAAMAELTANVIDVLYNRLGSIRDMAHRVNANVTNWYSSIWQYSANIVAVDFVRGTGIVEAAIKANENRHFHCRY
ncbi:uncharacterized protein LOC116429906 isoform X2 [Nomia melanderi]|uniref:uncharacterized protein LOC116429906 isoform X2 n=1 Tax=Nomia melanderi TaxID=2448451 RepID=UPI0013040EFD|nr:uncharacterized protein LOC116429906 isoform X2 [Nomia melanderi]